MAFLAKLERFSFYILICFTVIAQIAAFAVGMILFDLYVLILFWACLRFFYRTLKRKLNTKIACYVICCLLVTLIFAIYANSLIRIYYYLERQSAYPTKIHKLTDNVNLSIFLPYAGCDYLCIDLLLDGKFEFVETKGTSAGFFTKNHIPKLTRWKLVKDRVQCWKKPRLFFTEEYLYGINLWLLAQGACIIPQYPKKAEARFTYSNERLIDKSHEKLQITRIFSTDSPNEFVQNVYNSVSVVSIPPLFGPVIGGYGVIAYGEWQFSCIWLTSTDWLRDQEFLNQAFGLSLKHRIHGKRFNRAILGTDALANIMEAAKSEQKNLQQSVALIMCQLEMHPDLYRTELTKLRELKYKCVRPF